MRSFDTCTLKNLSSLAFIKFVLGIQGCIGIVIGFTKSSFGLISFAIVVSAQEILANLSPRFSSHLKKQCIATQNNGQIQVSALLGFNMKDVFFL